MYGVLYCKLYNLNFNNILQNNTFTLPNIEVFKVVAEFSDEKLVYEDDDKAIETVINPEVIEYSTKLSSLTILSRTVAPFIIHCFQVHTTFDASVRLTSDIFPPSAQITIRQPHSAYS